MPAIQIRLKCTQWTSWSCVTWINIWRWKSRHLNCMMRLWTKKTNAINLLFNAFGGKSNGDRQRPSFGEIQAVLAHAVLDANDAKHPGLISLSVDAGDEQRASKLMARNGLLALEKWNSDCSLVDVLRPSGPNARICGDEPRCAWRFQIDTH